MNMWEGRNGAGSSVTCEAKPVDSLTMFWDSLTIFWPKRSLLEKKSLTNSVLDDGLTSAIISDSPC